MVYIYRKRNDNAALNGVSIFYIDSRHARVNIDNNVHTFRIKSATKEIYPEKLFVQSQHLRYLPSITNQMLRYYLDSSAIAPYGVHTGAVGYFYHCGHRCKSMPFRQIDVERYYVTDNVSTFHSLDFRVDMRTIQSDSFQSLLAKHVNASDGVFFESEFFPSLVRFPSTIKMVAIRTSKLSSMKCDIIQCRDIGVFNSADWSPTDPFQSIDDFAIVKAVNGCKYAFELSESGVPEQQLKLHAHLAGADFLIRYCSNEHHRITEKAKRQSDALEQIIARSKRLMLEESYR